MKVVKIKPDAGSNTNFTLNQLQLHVILFKHDAQKVVHDCLNAEHVEGVVRLLFVCNRGEVDQLMIDTLRAHTLLGRSFVVYQWLALLEATHVAYRDAPQPSLPPFEQMRAAFQANLANIVRDADVVTTWRTVTMVTVRYFPNVYVSQ
jgi:hypothetical protein